MTIAPDATTQLPPDLDTSGPTAQHRIFSSGLPKDSSFPSTSLSPVQVPVVDLEDESQAITWHNEDGEAPFSHTTETRMKNNSVLSVQRDSNSEWSQFTESASSEHHLTSWETISAATFVEDPLKPAQKEESPTDYVSSGMTEESSGEMTDFPFASVAGDFLFSQTSAAGDEGLCEEIYISTWYTYIL